MRRGSADAFPAYRVHRCGSFVTAAALRVACAAPDHRCDIWKAFDAGRGEPTWELARSEDKRASSGSEAAQKMGGMKFASLAILSGEALSQLAAPRRGGTEQQVQTRLRRGPTPTRCGPRGRERLFARRQGTKPCRAKRVRCRASLRSSRRWLYFVNTFSEGVY